MKILGFMGHVVSVTSIQFSCCSKKLTIDNTQACGYAWFL